MRSGRIRRIIRADPVCVIWRGRRLRQITQTEALIIRHILREPNLIIVLLFICIFIRLSKQELFVIKYFSPLLT